MPLDGPPALDAAAEVAAEALPPAVEPPAPLSVLVPATPLPQPLAESDGTAAAVVDETAAAATPTVLPMDDVVEVVPSPRDESVPPVAPAPRPADREAPPPARGEAAAAHDVSSSAHNRSQPGVERELASPEVHNSTAAIPTTTLVSPPLETAATGAKTETAARHTPGAARVLPVLSHDPWRPGAWSAPPRAPFALVVAMLLGLLAMSPPLAGWVRLGTGTARLHPADVRFRLARPG